MARLSKDTTGKLTNFNYAGGTTRDAILNCIFKKKKS